MWRKWNAHGKPWRTWFYSTYQKVRVHTKDFSKAHLHRMIRMKPNTGKSENIYRRVLFHIEHGTSLEWDLILAHFWRLEKWRFETVCINRSSLKLAVIPNIHDKKLDEMISDIDTAQGNAEMSNTDIHMVMAGKTSWRDYDQMVLQSFWSSSLKVLIL